MPRFFIGVDISKKTLDIALLHREDILFQDKIENAEVSIRNLLSTLRVNFNCNRLNTIFCAEHTGLYSTFLTNVLHKRKMPICLESGLRIKRSQGIQRGKSDAVDAKRIAVYARRHFNDLKFWEAPRDCLILLKNLLGIRKRLLKVKTILTNTSKCETYYLPKRKVEWINSYSINSVHAIEEDIRKAEKEMMNIINNDEELEHLLGLITSVPGIGKVTGIHIIVATNEFKNFSSSKKFACYCGVAPFQISSGTSLNLRGRISHLANKELKILLHMSALRFTRNGNSQLRRYYLRKVAEGKNKMSILNAIRNKLIHRIFSCVRTGRKYEEPNLKIK